jgi:NAD(P)H-hydrate epimerase
LLPTGKEAAAFDRHAIDELGVPHFTLMENAGRSAALLVHRLYPRGRVVALAGSGNNGGDALVVARNLSAWGREVRVILTADRPEGETVLHGWGLDLLSDHELGDDEGSWAEALSGAGVVVDGILGTGVSGPPRDRQARAIDAVNRSGAPVFALDVPSGVDASTGSAPGSAVFADVTVALGWPKLGTLLQPGRRHSGRLIAVEIGFPPPGPEGFPARLITPTWALGARPVRPPVTHKNAVGNLLVVAGREGMAGAAVLGARAAIRAGVGYVRVASLPENREIVQRSVPDAVFVSRNDSGALSDACLHADAFLIGPGMGTGRDSRDLLERLLDLRGDRPAVLDADALTLLAEMGREALQAWASRGPVVVTPHPGEMARLTGKGIHEIQGDPVAAARGLAEASGAVTLLKGTPSLVASPHGRLSVDSVGTSDLAAAGMGDALAGCLGSFLAQAVEAETAAGLALVTSGRAAVRARRGAGLSPEDVIQHLPDALQEGPGETELDFPFLTLDLDPSR